MPAARAAAVRGAPADAVVVAAVAAVAAVVVAAAVAAVAVAAVSLHELVSLSCLLTDYPSVFVGLSRHHRSRSMLSQPAGDRCLEQTGRVPHDQIFA